MEVAFRKRHGRDEVKILELFHRQNARDMMMSTHERKDGPDFVKKDAKKVRIFNTTGSYISMSKWQTGLY